MSGDAELDPSSLVRVWTLNDRLSSTRDELGFKFGRALLKALATSLGERPGLAEVDPLTPAACLDCLQSILGNLR
jgi:hypothetical protein